MSSGCCTEVVISTEIWARNLERSVAFRVRTKEKAGVEAKGRLVTLAITFKGWESCRVNQLPNAAQHGKHVRSADTSYLMGCPGSVIALLSRYLFCTGMSSVPALEALLSPLCLF